MKYLHETHPKQPKFGGLKVTDGRSTEWLPKAMIDFKFIDNQDNLEIEMPETLAKQKGFI